MIDITPSVRAGSRLIQGYGNGSFRVSDATYAGPLLVTLDEVLPWNVDEPVTLNIDSFASLIGRAKPVEVVLIGGGATGFLLPSALRNALRQAGISADVMDTGAACRTYNVLAAEERHVAAALFPV